jgi:hypothetical protein
LEIRPATRADLAALKPLFAAAFQAELPERDWIWKYHENPHSAVSAVALEGERALGFYGGWATRYRGAKGDLPGVSATDVMTDPSARALGQRGVFRSVGEAYCRLNAERGVPFYFGFPNDRHRIVGERVLGYRSVERAGQLRRALPLPPRPAGLLSRFRRTRIAVRPSTSFGGEHDELAEALHARDGWRSDRSRATLTWRFAARPGVPYRIHAALDPRGRSHGFGVLRVVMDRALVVDLQLVDEGSGVLADLLSALALDATSEGATSLVVRCPREGWLARRLGGELGFEPEEADAHFEVRALRTDFDLGREAPLFDYRYADHDVF